MSVQGRLVSEILDEYLEALKKPLERYPVLNRETREPIEAQKRAIIHERDGGRCWYCDMAVHPLTVDHIVPRSTFPADLLELADRSDNLVSACWPCNERKSNYRRIWNPRRPGVTARCWECLHGCWEECTPACGHETGEAPEQRVVAFCGRHGTTTRVPDESWLL